jgi:hypothetical protein
MSIVDYNWQEVSPTNHMLSLHMQPACGKENVKKILLPKSTLHEVIGRTLDQKAALA